MKICLINDNNLLYWKNKKKEKVTTQGELKLREISPLLYLTRSATTDFLSSIIWGGECRKWVFLHK